MNVLLKFANQYKRLARGFAAFCVICITLVVFAGVLGRYVFTISLPWVEELSKFLLMWMVYLGVAMVSFEGQHLKADVIGSALGKNLSRIRNVLFEILQFLLMAIIVVITFKVAFQIKPYNQVSAVLGIPQWIMIFIFTIGLLGDTFMHLIRMIAELQNVKIE
ncbi:MAG: TRAP transporter small permease [Rectinema sp.]